jgi:hypothetical protein
LTSAGRTSTVWKPWWLVIGEQAAVAARLAARRRKADLRSMGALIAAFTGFDLSSPAF